MQHRLRGRFALGFAIAFACVLLAALLWAGAMVASWQHDCRGPEAASNAIEKPVSTWPPGVKCIAPHRARGAAGPATYVHEALPFAPAAILALAGFAVVALIAGIVAGLRDRKRRQAEPPPVPGVP
jgi:hypothetical protein